MAGGGHFLVATGVLGETDLKVDVDVSATLGEVVGVHAVVAFFERARGLESTEG